MQKNIRRLLLIFLLGVLSFTPNLPVKFCQEALAGPMGMDEPSPPEHPLTLDERLVLQNAVSVLWQDTALQKPEALQALDPTALDIPRDIFVDPPNDFFYNGDDIWIFEGMVRKMAVQSDGIEGISKMQSFHMQAKRQADGTFRIVSIHFPPLDR
ncbi:MAG: hypothetical protein IJD16_08800 [Desulfovibrio sp.]|nr:hypothetical protein [Desulfovibrio sp.]